MYYVVHSLVATGLTAVAKRAIGVFNCKLSAELVAESSYVNLKKIFLSDLNSLSCHPLHQWHHKYPNCEFSVEIAPFEDLKGAISYMEKQQ